MRTYILHSLTDQASGHFKSYYIFALVYYIKQLKQKSCVVNEGYTNFRNFNSGNSLRYYRIVKIINCQSVALTASYGSERYAYTHNPFAEKSTLRLLYKL